MLDNVDQTHLVLASGKLELQKTSDFKLGPGALRGLSKLRMRRTFSTKGEEEFRNRFLQRPVLLLLSP